MCSLKTQSLKNLSLGHYQKCGHRCVGKYTQGAACDGAKLETT